MARVLLPASLVRLFPGAPAEVTVQAETLDALVDQLEARWPGMRDRLCHGRRAVREHVLVFVDGERAHLGTPLRETSEVQLIPAVSGGH